MFRTTAALVLLAALAVSGCRSGRTAAPSPTPTAAGVRIGVVDVDAVARAHPRWPELDALNRQAQEVEGELAAPPRVPPILQARFDAQMKAQARRLEGEFQAEMRALRARKQQDLDRYAAQVRAEQQARAVRIRAEIEAEVAQALETRVRALRADLRQYEAQVIEEYRFPIANLRLKADVVGVASEEELRALTTELERLFQERDAKVRARAEVLDVALQDFRKAKEAEANARLARLQREAEAEAKRLLAAREREIRTEADRTARMKEQEFRRRLNAFRRQLLGIGEGQLASAQRKYIEGLRQREKQLLAERQALQGQRARLEDSILADVKIEVAAIAAARGYDVVLTRYLSNLTGEDFTAEVLARMKR